MRHSFKWIAIMLALSIAACGKSSDEAKPSPPPPVKDTVFGDMVASKDRAKQQTEQAVEQSKQKMDDAIKKSEEAGATP